MTFLNEPIIKEAKIVDVDFGVGVVIIKPVNLYRCVIGNGVFIGPFVEIQKGVKIGNNCRVCSHSFICELVEIGDDCFISHGAKFINDTFSRGKRAYGDRSLWKPTSIGNRVSIGTNATILPVKIVDGIVVGAGSVVTKDLLIAGIYAGNPASLIRKL